MCCVVKSILSCHDKHYYFTCVNNNNQAWGQTQATVLKYKYKYQDILQVQVQEQSFCYVLKVQVHVIVLKYKYKYVIVLKYKYFYVLKKIAFTGWCMRKVSSFHTYTLMITVFKSGIPYRKSILKCTLIIIITTTVI